MALRPRRPGLPSPVATAPPPGLFAINRRGLKPEYLGPTRTGRRSATLAPGGLRTMAQEVIAERAS